MAPSQPSSQEHELLFNNHSNTVQHSIIALTGLCAAALLVKWIRRSSKEQVQPHAMLRSPRAKSDSTLFIEDKHIVEVDQRSYEVCQSLLHKAPPLSATTSGFETPSQSAFDPSFIPSTTKLGLFNKPILPTPDNKLCNTQAAAAAAEDETSTKVSLDIIVPVASNTSSHPSSIVASSTASTSQPAVDLVPIPRKFKNLRERSAAVSKVPSSKFAPTLSHGIENLTTRFNIRKTLLKELPDFQMLLYSESMRNGVLMIFTLFPKLPAELRCKIWELHCCSYGQKVQVLGSVESNIGTLHTTCYQRPGVLLASHESHAVAIKHYRLLNDAQQHRIGGANISHLDDVGVNRYTLPAPLFSFANEYINPMTDTLSYSHAFQPFLGRPALLASVQNIEFKSCVWPFKSTFTRYLQYLGHPDKAYNIWRPFKSLRLLEVQVRFLGPLTTKKAADLAEECRNLIAGHFHKLHEKDSSYRIPEIKVTAKQFRIPRVSRPSMRKVRRS